MHSFWTAFIYVFLAEVGDKTQLMTVGFTARYKASLVLSATICATGLLNLFSVGLGEAIGKALPMNWVKLVAGIAFITFGLLELRPEQDGEEAKTSGSHWGPFFTIMFAFFVAELGDKTMLATFAIATREHDFWQVWAGSTLGLSASNGLAVIAGHFLKNYLSLQKLRYGIAAVYIISGITAIMT